MATFAGDVNRKNPQNRLQIPLIKSDILVKSVSIPAIGRAFTRSLVGDYIDGMAEAFVPIFTSHDHRALIPVMEAMTGENRYPRLGEIEIPTTVLVGTADHTTPPFHTDDLHAGIAGSKLVRLTGKGHALNWEAPDVVAAEVALLSGARAPS
jgi:pimeloyl-ACP methyl ester carboxylesterase